MCVPKYVTTDYTVILLERKNQAIHLLYCKNNPPLGIVLDIPRSPDQSKKMINGFYHVNYSTGNTVVKTTYTIA